MLLVRLSSSLTPGRKGIMDAMDAIEARPSRVAITPDRSTANSSVPVVIAGSISIVSEMFDLFGQRSLGDLFFQESRRVARPPKDYYPD